MRCLPAAVIIMALSLMASGCATRTFMVYKDGNNFFITRDCAERHRLLCDSGDIDRIAASSGLPEPLSSRLITAICATDGARNEMQNLLEELTEAQLSSLKNAFVTSGYEINKPVDT